MEEINGAQLLEQLQKLTPEQLQKPLLITTFSYDGYEVTGRYFKGFRVGLYSGDPKEPEIKLVKG